MMVIIFIYSKKKKTQTTPLKNPAQIASYLNTTVSAEVQCFYIIKKKKYCGGIKSATTVEAFLFFVLILFPLF